jgi:hypothetical protein
MTLTSTKVKEIAAGTEGVTPGPWERVDCDNHTDRGKVHSYAVSQFDAKWSPHIVDALNSGVASERVESDEDGSYVWDEQGEKDLAHIANCDPDTVKELCRLALIGIEAERVRATDTAGEDDWWIEWKGGECPVAPDALIYWKLWQDGKGSVCGPAHPHGLVWRHGGDGKPRFNDIIAYRVVAPPHAVGQGRAKP